MEDIQLREKAIKDKMEFYFRENIPVHITLFKKNMMGEFIWLNGIIDSISDYDGYKLNDRELGQVSLFVSEIRDVVEYKPEVKK